MNKFGFLALALACARADILYRFGDRSDVVTSSPGTDVQYSPFPGGRYSKTYDQRLYQYPLEDIDEEIKIPPFDAPSDTLSQISFDKEVATIRNGLHRDITYQLSFRIPAEKLQLAGTSGSPICTLALIDYCDYGFYIDYEEVEQTPSFKFKENKRMDIEKMDAVVSQYSYILEFILGRGDFKTETVDGQTFYVLRLEKTFQYHLRYGEANRAGRTLYRMIKGFDLATNCWAPSPASDLAQLRQIPRYEWALESVFGKTDVAFVALDAKRKVQNFELPVGNTEHSFWVAISTKVLILYGMVVTMFALFTDYKKKNTKKEK